jgi:hypothetical protein
VLDQHPCRHLENGPLLRNVRMVDTHVELFSNDIGNVVEDLSRTRGRFNKVPDRRLAAVEFLQISSGPDGRIAL